MRSLVFHPALHGFWSAGSELAQQQPIDSDIKVEEGVQWISGRLHGSCPSMWHLYCYEKLSVPGLRSHTALLENRGRDCRAGDQGATNEARFHCKDVAVQRNCTKTWRSSGSAATAVLPVSIAKCVKSQAVPLLNPSLLSQARKIEGHNVGVTNGRFATTISSVLCHEY